MFYSMNWIGLLSFLVIAVGLYFLSQFSFVFFHTIVGLFTVIISLSAFIIVLNVRRNITNNYLFFIGIAFLFVGLIDFLQVIVYDGIIAIAPFSSQLWVSARFLQAFSLLIAPFFFKCKKFNYKLVILGYTVIASILVLLIFNGLIPDCTDTSFGWLSEYFVSVILVASIFLLRKNKSHFDGSVYVELSFGVFLAMISEVLFILYRVPYDFLGVTSQVLRVLAFYFFYKAIIENSLFKPFDTLFRQLKLKKEELSDVNVKLRELERLRYNFITLMTHHLKQPLTPIVGYADLIKDKLTGEERGYVDRIKVNSEKMLIMINRILNVFKLEAGELDFNFSRANLSDMINEVIAEEEPTIKLKGLRLTKSLRDVYVRFDFNRLKEVFYNLLSNAIKFTKSKIIVKSFFDRNNAYFSVRDNGVGLRRDELSSIFEKFYQTDIGKELGGTGVGLSIVKEIVEAHGGKIKVKSVFGRGAEFIVSIPRK